MLPYVISFKDDMQTNGRIFQVNGTIHLCGAGLTVTVPSQVYHQRMQQWIESRMPAPLVFTGTDATRCIMTARDGGGDVDVELKGVASQDGQQ